MIFPKNTDDLTIDALSNFSTLFFNLPAEEGFFKTSLQKFNHFSLGNNFGSKFSHLERLFLRTGVKVWPTLFKVFIAVTSAFLLVGIWWTMQLGKSMLKPLLKNQVEKTNSKANKTA